MIIFSANDVSLCFGERVLFRDVSFAVDQNDKIGLVGTNGAGKTTLLKLLNGQEAEDYTGIVTKTAQTKLGFMEQHVLSSSDITVYEEALGIFSDLTRLEAEIDEIHRKIDSGENEPQILERQMRLNERFQHEGGLTFRARTASMLSGMGFSADDQTKKIAVLSGGERSKLQLVKLLLSGANLLLLDEPTNHLDIAATEWLESYLLDFKGAYILISHDRYFLDKVTNKTFALDNRTLSVYNGNYTDYLRQYDERTAFLRKQYQQQLGEIARIEGIIEQQKRFNQAHNYVTIQSKQKQIDRIKAELVPPPPPHEHIKFRISCKEAHGTDVLSGEGLSFTTKNGTIFDNVSFDIKYGDRVFLLGSNGCGKSSLMKMIVGEKSVQSGKISIAKWISTGYFDQLQDLRLSSTKSVVDFIWDDFPRMNKTQVMSALAMFMIKGDETFKPVNTLSGGEAAKLILLKIMLRAPNLLLLDEPTNHLDLDARDGLISALEGYNGTLLIISHDRRLINQIGTKLLFLSADGIEQFDGNYDQWLAQRTEDSEQENSLEEKKTEPKPQNDYFTQKELQSQIRRLTTRRERLEKELELVEAQIEALNSSLLDGTRHYEQIMAESAELEQLTKRQEELLSEWDSADSELSQLMGKQ